MSNVPPPFDEIERKPFGICFIKYRTVKEHFRVGYTLIMRGY